MEIPKLIPKIKAVLGLSGILNKPITYLFVSKHVFFNISDEQDNKFKFMAVAGYSKRTIFSSGLIQKLEK